ncbi:WcaG Nucleoside-diphosphate-sugar epimerases [Candidatus Nanopelagicaceae bacterium]
MKFLVAGGAGFIGSSLTVTLLKQGHQVLVLDDFSTGEKQNLSEYLSDSNLEILTKDVTNIETLNFDVEGIFNLACPASPIQYQIDPVKTIRTSFMGSLNLLELAREKRVPIFQASTSEIYGDPTVSPQREDYWGNVNPIGIRSCYDEGKRAAETLFFDFHRQYGINIKVARIFNTYGPGMKIDDGRVVTNFIVSALQNKPITIYGEGTQTRSFCYIDDMVEAIIRFFNTVPEVVGPMNLGNPSEYTMLELASKIIKLTNSSSPLEYKSLPEDDPKQRRPDIRRAQELINWEPKISIDEGLTKTIAYLKDKIG